jgi:hypothetical protein
VGEPGKSAGVSESSRASGSGLWRFAVRLGASMPTMRIAEGSEVVDWATGAGGLVPWWAGSGAHGLTA